MSIFADLMKFARSLGSERRRVASQIETLKQQRDFLLTAAPPKCDVKDRLFAYLDGERDVLRDNLQRQVAMFTSRPDMDPGKVWMGPAILRRAVDGKFDERLILAIIGDLAKERIAQIIEGLDWPEAGPPCGERQKQLEKLDREIAGLTKELEDLNKSADLVKEEV